MTYPTLVAHHPTATSFTVAAGDLMVIVVSGKPLSGTTTKMAQTGVTGAFTEEALGRTGLTTILLFYKRMPTAGTFRFRAEGSWTRLFQYGYQFRFGVASYAAAACITNLFSGSVSTGTSVSATAVAGKVGDCIVAATLSQYNSPAGTCTYPAAFTKDATGTSESAGHWFPGAAGSYAETWTFSVAKPWLVAGLAITTPLSAPSAPTLDTPANGVVVDATPSVTLKSTYHSTDGYAANAYVLRIKKSTAATYSYYNATTNALQATEVWNACSVATGGVLSVVLSGTLIPGGFTWDWSAAFQESGANLQGPFAATYTFTSKLKPVVTITYPTTLPKTSQFTVTWTFTNGPQKKKHVRVFKITQFTIAGFTPATSPSLMDSTLLTTTAPSWDLPSALSVTVQKYRIYVLIETTGTLASAWAYVEFAITPIGPSAPTLTVAGTTQGSTAYPVNVLTAKIVPNLLSKDDADFIALGTWTAVNASLALTGTWRYSGLESLKSTSTVAAVVSVLTGKYACTVGEAVTLMIVVQAPVVTPTVSLKARWYKATGAVLSTTTLGTHVASTTGFLLIGHTTVPATATDVALLCEWTATAVTQVVRFDTAGYFATHVTTWSSGGFATATATVHILSSTTGSNWTEIRESPKSAKLTKNAVVSAIDGEYVPNITRHYKAYASTITTTKTVTSKTSAPVTRKVTNGECWLFTPKTIAGTAVRINTTGTQNQFQYSKTKAMTVEAPLGSSDYDAMYDVQRGPVFTLSFWIKGNTGLTTISAWEKLWAINAALCLQFGYLNMKLYVILGPKASYSVMRTFPPVFKITTQMSQAKAP